MAAENRAARPRLSYQGTLLIGDLLIALAAAVTIDLATPGPMLAAAVATLVAVAVHGALGAYAPDARLERSAWRATGLMCVSLCVARGPRSSSRTPPGRRSARRPRRSAAFWSCSAGSCCASSVRLAWARSPERVLVIGGGEVGCRVMEMLPSTPQVKFVGYVDDDPPTDTRKSIAANWLGGIDDLPGLLASRRVDRVLVCFSQRPDVQTLEVIRACDASGVHVDIVPRLFELLPPSARAYGLGSQLTVMSIAGRRTGGPCSGPSGRSTSPARAWP